MREIAKYSRIRPAVDELAFLAAINEAGVREDAQMVGNGGGGHAAKRNDLAAIHQALGVNGLEDQKACFVPQSLGNTFDSLPVHRHQRKTLSDQGAKRL